jgi:hypothetical protein
MYVKPGPGFGERGRRRLRPVRPQGLPSRPAGHPPARGAASSTDTTPLVAPLTARGRKRPCSCSAPSGPNGLVQASVLPAVAFSRPPVTSCGLIAAQSCPTGWLGARATALRASAPCAPSQPPAAMAWQGCSEQTLLGAGS